MTQQDEEYFKLIHCHDFAEQLTDKILELPKCCFEQALRLMNKTSCCDGWWFSWKDSEGQKKRDNMSLTSTHKSKRIQSSWLLGVLPPSPPPPPQIPQPGNTRWEGFYLHCSFSTTVGEGGGGRENISNRIWRSVLQGWPKSAHALLLL